MNKNLIAILAFLVASSCATNDTISISGIVTDFDGKPIDSCLVQLLSEKFEPIRETYSNNDGFYKIDGLKKGRYAALYAIREKEYPRANAVAEQDMRLEFWAWNVVADTDLTINPRYQKLELYGTTVFEELGGYKGLFVYFRPMSLTKYISYSKEVYLDKKKAEKTADISINPQYLKVKVFANGEELKVNSVQPVQEYQGAENLPMTAFLVQVDAPKTKPQKPYVVFRVEAENTEYGEKGENWYFYEVKRWEE